MADEVQGAEYAAPGMPQLDLTTFPNQIFWLVVTLIVIYLILSRVAIPRISSVLAERQGSLTNDISAAEDYKRKAVDAEAAYEKALSDARAEAMKIAEQTRAEIQKDLDRAIAKADAEIQAKTEQSNARIAEIQANATNDVSAVAQDIAADIAASVAPGHAIDRAALTAAVADHAKG
jgi:F-type H+-transporting ATPase subunit b